MSFPLESLAVAQCFLTTLSSGFNIIYLFGYRTEVARRRVGALVLSLVSLATFVQSLYFSLSFLFRGVVSVERLLLDARHWFIIGLLAMLGSLAISALILRQLTSLEKRSKE